MIFMPIYCVVNCFEVLITSLTQNGSNGKVGDITHNLKRLVQIRHCHNKSGDYLLLQCLEHLEAFIIKKKKEESFLRMLHNGLIIS